MIINQAGLEALFTAIKTAFNKGLKNAETYWEKIATPVPSSTRENKYTWLGEFPRLRKWIGDRQVKNLAAHDYSIKNEPYEGTIGVPRDDIEDDTYGVFAPLYEEMGYAAATHPDELVFELLPKGFTSLCFDGQNYFDTDHPVGNEETGITSVSNMQAGAGAPWYLMDTNRPIKPIIFQKRKDYKLQAMTKDEDESVFMRKEYRYGVDARVNAGFALWQLAFGSKADLTTDNFDAALAAMMGFKSDEGRPLGVNPNILVTGPANRAKAKKVIEKARLANGEDNHNYKAVEVLVVPWLA